MLVSSNFRAISALLCVFILGACAPVGQSAVESDQSYDELSNDLGRIEVNIAAFEDLPGETRAEKLLYQSGIVSQMQTTMLIMFDTQARTLRLAGNNEVADELMKSRDLMMDAVDIELETMIAEAGLLYEELLGPEDIDRLIVLHSDPAMKKLILNQPKLAQGMVPIGERFGVNVSIRYEELLKNKKPE